MKAACYLVLFVCPKQGVAQCRNAVGVVEFTFCGSHSFLGVCMACLQRLSASQRPNAEVCLWLDVIAKITW